MYNVYLQWSLLTSLHHLLQQSAARPASYDDDDDVIENRPDVAETARTSPTSTRLERKQVHERERLGG